MKHYENKIQKRPKSYSKTDEKELKKAIKGSGETTEKPLRDNFQKRFISAEGQFQQDEQACSDCVAVWTLCTNETTIDSDTKSSRKAFMPHPLLRSVAAV